MPVIIDFVIDQGDDESIVLDLVPPTPIGGIGYTFQVGKRFGWASGLITKSVASGFDGASGITILDSGAGRMRIDIDPIDTSGFQFGNYAYQIWRESPRQVATQGFMLCNP